MNYNPRHNSKLFKTVSTLINHDNYFLNFLKNIIVVIAVAIIEIILAIIEAILNLPALAEYMQMQLKYTRLQV